MIRYYRLFALLSLRGMKKTDLYKVISSPTLAKLSKGETVQTDVIDRICKYLKCQPGDIMECVETEESLADGIVLYTTKEGADNVVPDDRINTLLAVENNFGDSRIEHIKTEIE